MVTIDRGQGQASHRHPGRGVRAALLATVFAGLLVSCTTEGVLAPSARIDPQATVGAVTPAAPVPAAGPYGAPVPAEDFYPSSEPVMIPAAPIGAQSQVYGGGSYGAPQATVSALPSYGSLSATAPAAGQPIPPDPYALPAQSLPPGWSVGPQAAGQMQAAPAAPPVYAAPQPVGDPYAGRAPGLAGIAPMAAAEPIYDEPVYAQPAPVMDAGLPPASGPMEAAPPVFEPAPPMQAPAPAQVQEQPRRFAGLLPRALNPMRRASDPYAGVPAAEAACQQRLKKLGVTFTAKPAVGNGKSCGIAHPIEVAALSGDIRIQPATVVNCPMAEALALWVKNELAPGTRKRYLSGIKSIGSMGGYSCRTMNSRRGAPMSEHARGNAIDIGKINLDNGRSILVRDKGFFAFRERGLLKSARNDACKYFTTILGPGSDANHADHFHFDLRDRRNGYRHCD
jgi:hypothetical protein